MTHKQNRLEKIREGAWVSKTGTLKIFKWDWCSQPWCAQWTDIFGVEHDIREYTRERLADRLKPYGLNNFILSSAKDHK